MSTVTMCNGAGAHPTWWWRVDDFLTAAQMAIDRRAFWRHAVATWQLHITVRYESGAKIKWLTVHHRWRRIALIASVLPERDVLAEMSALAAGQQQPAQQAVDDVQCEEMEREFHYRIVGVEFAPQQFVAGRALVDPEPAADSAALGTNVRDGLVAPKIPKEDLAERLDDREIVHSRHPPGDGFHGGDDTS